VPCAARKRLAGEQPKGVPDGTGGGTYRTVPYTRSAEFASPVSLPTAQSPVVRSPTIPSVGTVFEGLECDYGELRLAEDEGEGRDAASEPLSPVQQRLCPQATQSGR